MHVLIKNIALHDILNRLASTRVDVGMMGNGNVLLGERYVIPPCNISYFPVKSHKNQNKT